MSCGDNSCIFGRPTGMGTNGGCVCTARELRIGIIDLKRTLATMRKERDTAEGESARLRAAMVELDVETERLDPGHLASVSTEEIAGLRGRLGEVEAGMREMETEILSARKALHEAGIPGSDNLRVMIAHLQDERDEARAADESACAVRLRNQETIIMRLQERLTVLANAARAFNGGRLDPQNWAGKALRKACEGIPSAVPAPHHDGPTCPQCGGPA